MKKNVASQVIGCQMISATDGSAFTGSVTVYVTGNAGTQAIGSVGSGACTHEGNGFHTYAPAQAETNYDHVAFTFIGTGAIPATVQVFPTFPQTGDSFALIGATGSGLTSLASAANLATVAGYLDTEIADIQSRLPAALVSGRMDASVGAMASGVLTATAIASDAITAAKVAGDVTTELQTGLATAASLATVAGYIDTEVAAIKTVTDRLDTAMELDGSVYRFTTNALEQAPTGSGSGLDAAGVRAAIGLASANLDTQLGAIDTTADAILVDTAEIGAAGAGLTALASAANLATVAGYLDTEIAAIKAKTDNLPASPAAVGSAMTLTSGERTSVADALLDRDMSAGTDSGSPTVRTVRQALRFLRNKWSIATSTLTVTKEDDTTASWTATVSTTPGADPITGNDPA